MKENYCKPENLHQTVEDQSDLSKALTTIYQIIPNVNDQIRN